MKASLEFTVWTVVVFSCLFEISHAQCDNVQSCNGSVSFTTTTTTITAQNCSLSIEGPLSQSSLANLLPGGVYAVFAHCLNCCLEATTKPEKVINFTAESTTTSLSLSWIKPSGNVSSYNVNWTGGGESNSTMTSQTSADIYNLTPGVKFTVTVTTVAGDGLTKGMEATLLQYTKPEQIKNLVVSNVTTSSMTVNWTEPEGLSSFYIVQWSDKSASMTMTFNVTDTSTVITNLTAGTEYNITVAAVAGDIRTVGDGTLVTRYTMPEKIQNLVVSNVTTSSMTVSWTEPEGLSSFYIVQWSDKSASMTMTFNVTDTFTVITNLTAGTEYNITVAAVAGDIRTVGDGTLVTRYTKPEQIKNLVVSNVTTSSMTVSWTEPEGLSSFYIVQWSDKSASMTMTFNVTDTSTVITNLTAGTEYNITVAAVAGDIRTVGDGTLVTRYTMPEKIQNLVVSNVTTSSMTVSWTEPEGLSSFYIVQWTDKSASMTMTFNVTDTSTVITNLTAGTEYNITVAAVAGDIRTVGDGTLVTRYTKPEQIKNLVVSNVTTSSMTVSWTEPEGLSSFYIVQWSDKSASMTMTFNVTDTFTVITNLTAGTEYNITVAAVAGDIRTVGDGTLVTRYTKPNVIKNLEVRHVTTLSWTVTWSKPEGHSLFYIVLWTDKNTGINMTYNVTETSTVFSNLISGVEYSVTVTAVAGDSKTRGSGTSKSWYTVPAKPVNIIANPRGTHSLNISWLLPEGNVDYFVVHLDEKKNQTRASWLHFSDLFPGRLHAVDVTAVAGYLNNTSDRFTFATYPLPPVSIDIIKRTNSSLDLSWGIDPKMRDVPRINYTIAYEGRVSDPVTSTVNNVRLSSLDSGTKYEIVVRTVGPESLHSSGVNVSACTNPNPVLNLRAYPDSNTSAKAEWSYPQDHKESYSYLMVTFDASGNTVNNQSVQRNYTVITGLDPGTGYNITVATLLTSECYSTKEEVHSRTKPNPVSNLQVYFVNTTTITLTWNCSDDYEPAPSYLVQVQQGPNVVHNDTTATQMYTFSDLTPGEHYDFTVVTEVARVRSDKETIKQQMKPTAVTITEVTGGTTHLAVSWSEAEGKVDTYTVRLYSDTHQVQIKENLSNDTLAASFTDLTPGVLYCAEVVTKSGDLEKNSSKTCNGTWPAVVTITEVTGSTTQLAVSWSEAEGKVDSYTVRLYNDIHQVEMKEDLSNDTLAASFTDLTPGVLYCAEVVTKSGDLTNHSTRVCNTTWPAAVTITEVTGSTTHLTVSWSEAEGKVDSYTVRLYNDTLQVQMKEDLSNDTLATDFTDLKPGVLYCAEVVTRSGQLENKSSVLCNATFPNPPRNISVASQTERSLTFIWDAPEDMQPDQYSFSVSTYSKPEEKTPNSSLTLNELESGSPYSIAVVTVGVNGYKSQEVSTQAYTRPFSVTGLQQTEITPDSVTLMWNQTEHKSNYRYFIAVSPTSGDGNSTVISNLTHKVDGLISGTNYSFTVTAQAADGTAATPETVSYFTRPYRIEAFVADTINTTTINLTWEKPAQYKEEYMYLVEISGCSNPRNHTIRNESVEISGLTPGTNCSCCVTVRAANGIEGESTCTSQYTKPEKALPRLSSHGSNSSLRVSWAKPPGIVECYTVYLNGTETNSTSVKLNSSGRFHTFEGLPAGRLYTVVVVTQSGPFNVSSESVTNATFPNPPGAIILLNKTTGSFHISWEEAPLMSGAQFHYRLEIQSKQVNYTTLTHHVFGQLLSGTSYSVAVTTVAALGLESEAVWQHKITTRPFSVTGLLAHPSEESVRVNWSRPVEYKSTYRFSVTLLNSARNILRNETTTELAHTFRSLDPGSSYYFTVTTETSDGTKGAPEETHKCTNAGAVKLLECTAPNEPKAKITWSWKEPKGHFTNFIVKLEDSPKEELAGCCQFETSPLKHFTYYTVGVTTQSCGEPSITIRKTCQTGITNPPIPENHKSLLSLVEVEHNTFTIKINRSLLDTTNGPIKNIGVLMTERANVVEQSKTVQYLSKIYDQWKRKEADAYLATIIDIKDPGENARTRSSPDHLEIHIGDETTWNGYLNGLLEPTQEYKFAVVLFTDLKIKSDLLNGKESLFSATTFDNIVTLPQNPVVIGAAVGGTLATLCVLLIILIVFIIYWRRLSHKEPSDIQISSLRAKVSVLVRVEDYEVYYKKQKADSNCGFAAEYEDLKVVGTGLTKANAQNPENKTKNRYNNVLPYDLSRVKLSIIHGNPIDDYINANYIPGYNSRKEFIAAQGPLPSTVNDFWRMIWEKNVHTMVMLTRCNEQGRVKCEQYWTPSTKHFGNITVTTTSEIPLDDWTIRDFDIKNVKTAETRSVRHFHFTAWPDHGVPETTELLISFRHLVREHMDQYKHSPTVVHCSAGVGRTGTFIAIDRLIFQIERENTVDVYGIVHDMRMHRVLMVQTEDQYVFLNQCAMDIIRSRTGTNVDLIYQNTTALSIYENIELQKR